jgi:hypothetical protein
MIGWHGEEPIAIHQYPYRLGKRRIMTGAKPSKKRFQYLSAETVGNPKSQEAQRDKDPRMVLVLPETVIKHEYIEGYPGIRIAEDWHYDIEYAAV